MERYKGISPEGKWFRALCTVNGKTVTIGRYKTAERAAVAYDEFIFQLKGKAAELNFPERSPV